MSSPKILIVGSGLYGAVCARELTDSGYECMVLEKRSHIGGNCYSEYHEDAACHQHVYGPHIFHTNSKTIWDYINRFTAFDSYVHRVKANYRNELYGLPINLMTLYQLFGVRTPEEAKKQLEKECEPITNPRNLEEWCLSQMGQRIYETFFYGYTTKQWQKDPKELPASLIKRLPIRFSFDDNYYNHRYQGIPSEGYTRIFERLLEGVPVQLDVDFLSDRDAWMQKYDHTIYTGPIDAFFNYSEGVLEYRSLRFENELLAVQDFQGCSQMNYTNIHVPFTRIVEHKHFNLNNTTKRTLITYEYSETWKKGATPYYPINTEPNQKIFKAYKQKEKEAGLSLTIGGRLGEYRYYDMHQIIGAALVTVEKLSKQWKGVEALSASV